MIKPLSKVFFLSFCMLSTTNSQEAKPIQKSTLAIVVKDIQKQKRGKLYIAIQSSSSAANFPEEKGAIAKKIVSIKSRKQRIQFDLPKGDRYAVSIFQDHNGNGKLDVNFIGFPKEAYGLSNNPSKHLSPKFQRSSFSFDEAKEIVIRMLNYPL